MKRQPKIHHGLRLRERRHRLGLSQVEAAAKAGLTQAAWSRLEAAERFERHTVGLLSRAAKAVGWTLDKLVGGS